MREAMPLRTERGGSARNVSARLAAGKRETWGSALANSAFLNIPAFIRANKGEKPQVITVRNAIADVGVHSAYILAFGPTPSIISLLIGGASLARYQQKKGNPTARMATNDNMRLSRQVA